MDRRLRLHELLCEKLGSRNCYYDPPESVKLVYPCIIYKWDADENKHADNLRYFNKRQWTVIIIDRRADSPLPESIGQLPMCQLNRVYTADNLYHFTYRLYY